MLDEQPETADAFANGELGAEYLDIIANAIDRIPDSHRDQFNEKLSGLIEFARKYPLDAFRRHVTNIVEELVADGLEWAERQKQRTSMRTWIDQLTGMRMFLAQFDPETGERLNTASKPKSPPYASATSDLSPEQRGLRKRSST